MDSNLFAQLIKNVAGETPGTTYFTENIRQLNTHYSNQLGIMLLKCKSINAKIVNSIASRLLQEQWLSERRCMYCGQAGDMYDEYCCLSCSLRISPTLDREQKQRAAQIKENPKRYNKTEVLWADGIF